VGSRVLVVGFDAGDIVTAARLAADGRMPNLNRLLRAATQIEVEPPSDGTYVTSTWPTLVTGCRSERHRLVSWVRFNPHTYGIEDVRADVSACAPLWTVLGRSGARVAVFDVPRMEADQSLRQEVIQVSEWGTHDRARGPHSWPPGLIEEIVKNFGDQSLGELPADVPPQYAPCDWAHGGANGRRTSEELGRLRRALLRAVDAKAEASLHYLADRDWDLFLTVFAEPHCVGHHFWALHDRDDPGHDPAVAEQIGDPIAEVYAALDSGLGQLLERAGSDCTTFVIFSHGMGPYLSGSHLLDVVLDRVARHREHAPTSPLAVRAMKRAWRALPAPARRRLHPVAARAMRRRSARRGEPVPERTRDWPTRPYFAVPYSSLHGGVRLNVVGREAHGLVPQDSTRAVLTMLTEELLDLINVTTGRPAVRRAIRSENTAGDFALDGFPDLLVEWDRSGPVQTVYSPTIGLVSASSQVARSGDHRPRTLVLADGPGVRGNARLTGVPAERVAPTIAAMLGCELADADGDPLNELLRSALVT
jgi:predicted AlkP superfamily phosphohydrolase/phosphomutase